LLGAVLYVSTYAWDIAQDAMAAVAFPFSHEKEIKFGFLSLA
jgi:hypothetical protein